MFQVNMATRVGASSTHYRDADHEKLRKSVLRGAQPRNKRIEPIGSLSATSAWKIFGQTNITVEKQKINERELSATRTELEEMITGDTEPLDGNGDLSEEYWNNLLLLRKYFFSVCPKELGIKMDSHGKPTWIGVRPSDYRDARHFAGKVIPSLSRALVRSGANVSLKLEEDDGGCIKIIIDHLKSD
jgi:hypothetical protein